MTYDLELEQSLLTIALTNTTIANKLVGQITSDVFYSDAHAAIWDSIVSKLSAGQPVNVISILPDVQAVKIPDMSMKDYLVRLTINRPSVTNIASIVSELTSMATKRHIIRICTQAIEDTKALDPEAIISTLSDACHSTMPKSSVKTERQVMNEIWEDVSSNYQPQPTGLAKLDEAMDGGMYPRRAYGMLARKKIGKTMIASTIARNIADSGGRVLFIAAEMGDKEIQERVACRMMGVYPSAFRTDYRKSEEFSKKFTQALTNSTDTLFYKKAPGIMFSELKRLLYSTLHTHKIDGFILDYWQLVSGKGRLSEREHLDEVAQWIADFCRDNNVWAFVLAQENQDGNSRGGEGISLAFDQVFSLCGVKDTPYRWIEMKDTRYTQWMDIGSENNPSFRISEKGTHMEEMGNEPIYRFGA